MTTTSCIISFGANAIAIKDDATFSTTSIHTLGNLDDLANDTTVIKPYATYEPDFWLLDGNYKFAPATNIHAGYISAVMSPSNPASDFTVAPKIEINFSELHSLEEITLKFSELSGDWSDRISIGFFNGGSTISAAFYTPTSAEFTLTLSVANFNKIEIYFYSQNKAYRYARLSEIIFDELLKFSGSDIKAASLVEKISPLSTELPINTIDFTLYSDAGDFNIAAPSGLYANLQDKEPVDVHESINNEIVYIGRFYLDEWESLSEKLASFRASDAMTILESVSFLGGRYKSPTVYSEDLIAEIFENTGINYDFDASLNGIVVNGLIPYLTNCREALQQTLFYIGAYATCARSNLVKILPMPTTDVNDYELTSADKGINSPLTLRKMVTGVEVKQLSWNVNKVSQAELYNESLASGVYEIPLADNILDAVSGFDAHTGTGTYSVTLNRGFYCEVTVTAPGTVILKRYSSYNPIGSIVGVYNPSLPATAKENIIVINDALLINANPPVDAISAETIAQRVYDYYQRRFLQKTKLFASFITVGNSVLVDGQGGEQMSGIVEKMTTDLAGGFVSNVEIIGDIV